MVSVKVFKVGPLETNCYLLTDTRTKKSAIIDPGGISAKLDEAINVVGVENVEYILMTHGHFDHIRKAPRYKNLTGATLAIGKNEADFTKDRRLNLCRIPMEEFEADVLLNDGDAIKLGELTIQVIETPGHTKGGVCFVVGECIFTGDTIMKGTFGRCDLETGDFEQMGKSLEKIFALPGDYKIYPGHGDTSTLAAERANNSYNKKI